MSLKQIFVWQETNTYTFDKITIQNRTNCIVVNGILCFLSPRRGRGRGDNAMPVRSMDWEVKFPTKYSAHTFGQNFLKFGKRKCKKSALPFILWILKVEHIKTKDVRWRQFSRLVLLNHCRRGGYHNNAFFSLDNKIKLNIYQDPAPICPQEKQ